MQMMTRQGSNWLLFLCLMATLAALFLLPALDAQVAQLPPVATLVKAGRMLDPRTGNVLSPAAVLIEDGKIKEVGPPSQVQAHVPPGAKTIDLGSATLLPGLIDSHTHLLVNPVVPAEAERGAPVQRRICDGPTTGDCRIAKQAGPDGCTTGSRRLGERLHHGA